MTKARLTISIDPELLAAATEAVADGRAESVSAWVSAAMADRANRESLLVAGLAAVAAYEAEFGEITQEEMDEQERLDAAQAQANRVAFRGRRQAG